MGSEAGDLGVPYKSTHRVIESLHGPFNWERGLGSSEGILEYISINGAEPFEMLRSLK